LRFKLTGQALGIDRPADRFISASLSIYTGRRCRRPPAGPWRSTPRRVGAQQAVIRFWAEEAGPPICRRGSTTSGGPWSTTPTTAGLTTG